MEKPPGKIEYILRILYYFVGIVTGLLIMMVSLRQLGIVSVRILELNIPVPGILESFIAFQIVFDIMVIFIIRILYVQIDDLGRRIDALYFVLERLREKS
jgi:hypothetical protein